MIDVVMIIPAASREAANRLAAIIDPDTGGASTFSNEYRKGAQSFFVAQSKIGQATYDAFGDADAVETLLTAESQSRGIPAPSRADCGAVAGSLIVEQTSDFRAVLSRTGLTRAPDSNLGPFSP